MAKIREGRTTVYNRIYSDELWEKVNPANKELMNDYLDYIKSTKSLETQKQYFYNLRMLMCYIYTEFDNKKFIDIKKRELIRFQNKQIEELGLSPSRIKWLKSLISSLSEFIESILADEDEEYENFKKIIHKIESPVKTTVRKKTVYTDEEVQEILDKLVEDKKYQIACAFALGVYSGMRKKEMTLMKVEYFNEEHKCFDGAMYKTEPIRTKGRSTIGKVIPRYVLIGFEPYLKLWLDEREKLGIESEWLFLSNKGEQATIPTMDSMATVVNKYSKTPFYWHSLRHYCTSMLSRANIPANIIQEFQQWSDVSLVSLYDDNEAEDSFGQYFKKDGLVGAEEKSLTDL